MSKKLRNDIKKTNTKIKTPDGFLLDCCFKEIKKAPLIVFAHGMTVDRDDERIFVRAEKELNKNGFAEIGSRKFKIGEKLFKEMEQFFPAEELRKYKNKLFMVHGDKDGKIDYRNTVEAFNRLPNRLKAMRIIKNADHGFHKEPYETDVVKLLTNFFIK